MNDPKWWMIPVQILVWLPMATLVILPIKLLAPIGVFIGMMFRDDADNFPRWLFWFDNRKGEYGYADAGWMQKDSWSWKVSPLLAQFWYRGIRNGGSNFIRYAVKPSTSVYVSPWSHIGFRKGPKRWMHGSRDLAYLATMPNHVFTYSYDVNRWWLAEWSWTWCATDKMYMFLLFGFDVKHTDGAQFTFRPLPFYRNEDLS